MRVIHIHGVQKNYSTSLVDIETVNKKQAKHGKQDRQCFAETIAPKQLGASEDQRVEQVVW